MPNHNPMGDLPENPDDPFELLPHWAIGRAHGKLVLGAQLPTRDGRRCGNGHIIEIGDPTDWSQGSPIYLILTDAGTQLRLTAGEVAELYYQPMWVSNVAEVLEKFKDRDLIATRPRV